PGHGFYQNLHLAGCKDRQQPQSEKAAKLLDPRITFPSTAAPGGTHRKPDFVARGGSIDRLQYQFEREGELELADDDGGLFAIAQCHEVTTANLAFDLETELFEEALNGKV